MTTADHDRLIARLPVERRRNILDAACRRNPIVAVEHAYDRNLEGASVTVGTLVGVAYTPGGGSADTLVVRPLDPSLRLVALPAAHVLRIRQATPIRWANDPGKVGWKTGEVLAGPPIVREGVSA